MGRKKAVWILLVCGILWIMTGTVWAEEKESFINHKKSEVWAGVTIDYMGRLQFLVLEKESGIPVSGASVEIYISGLDRYVLFGVTDEQGIYETDVAYNPGEISLSKQTLSSDGIVTLRETMLYPSGRRISYQIQKSGWLPDPSRGEVLLDTQEIPKKVTIYLHKKRGGGSNTGTDSDSGNGQKPPLEETAASLPAEESETAEDPITGSVPKTGVEEGAGYLWAGLICLLLAGGILLYLYINERRTEGGERRN